MPRTLNRVGYSSQRVHDPDVLRAFGASPGDRVVWRRDARTLDLEVNINGRTLPRAQVAEAEARILATTQAAEPRREAQLVSGWPTFDWGRVAPASRAGATTHAALRREDMVESISTLETRLNSEERQRSAVNHIRINPRPYYSGELGSIDGLVIRGGDGARDTQEERIEEVQALARQVRRGAADNPYPPRRTTELTPEEYVMFNAELDRQPIRWTPDANSVGRSEVNIIVNLIESDIDRLVAAGFTVHTIALRPQVKQGIERHTQHTHIRNTGTLDRPQWVGEERHALHQYRLVEDDAIENYLIAVNPT